MRLFRKRKPLYPHRTFGREHLERMRDIGASRDLLELGCRMLIADTKQWTEAFMYEVEHPYEDLK